MAALDNLIYVGSYDHPTYTFTNRNIVMNTLKAVNTVDVVGNELSVDTFSFTVRYNPLAWLIYAPVGKDGYLDTNNAIYVLRSGERTAAKDYLRDVAYGMPVWWYIAGSFYAKGYIQSIERTAKTLWTVTCQSGIGLLNEVMHAGGMYNGTKFSVILSGIVGGAFGYSINNAVKDLLVYGHLPYDTARNNLHRLLFALGAAMTRRNATTDYTINFLSTSASSVPNSRIALGGSVSVQSASNQAEVTEHAYVALSGDPEETLFDNTSGTGSVDHALIVFSEPMHDLVGSGITIHESNCNYAVISGTGTLTGKKYTHIEKIITASNAATGDAIRAKRVTDNHLISAANSLNVARRVLSYYSSARTLKAKIQLHNERCGQNLSLADAFGDPTTAYLKKTEVLVTSVRGAQCELVEGYVPAWNGNNYTSRQIITASGSVTIPAGAKRLILIGGGSGGTGGYDGVRGRGGYTSIPSIKPGELQTLEDPDTGRITYYWDDQPVSPGGAAGTPGASGKIYVIDIEDSSTSATVVIGQGGSGGAKNGGAGSAGGATTVTIDGTTYTSEDGAPSEAGFIDALGNATYALPGAAGHAGGQGGQTDTYSTQANQGGAGVAGGSVGNYRGGAGGAGYNDTYSAIGPRKNSISGGGGGGAAWGANGGAGGAATKAARGSGWTYTTGSGGDGADAVAPSQPTYGCGGGGGNGGGAGGNCGGGIMWGYYLYVTPGNDLKLGLKGSSSPVPGYQGGAAGSGSVGGQGGDGCVIIYY
jgi:hypothetical protein